MKDRKALAAPCGLYCGVCGVYIATKDDNEKFKEKLTTVYGVPAEEIHCMGCLSNDVWLFCQKCDIKACCLKKGYEGCHQCSEFPCKNIDAFPIAVGKKVILRAIPTWRELGTEKWMDKEEKRYICPHCGSKLFRGAKRCRACRETVDVD